MKKQSLQARIEAANKAGRMARIPFITADFPMPETFAEALRELDENGADIIEIGIPFSDPVADGPVVEDASRRVLAKGTCLSGILRSLEERAFSPRAALVFMGYYNPFLQYGLERLADAAAAVGVQGFIVPDLPLEEGEEMREILAARGMDLIALVGPNTTLERMKEYAERSTGYVYVVSVMGVTGARERLPIEAAETLARAKEAFSLPVALGFGIQTPDQLKDMPIKPDAVVFGSALLRTLDDGGTAKEFMGPWLRQDIATLQYPATARRR